MNGTAEPPFDPPDGHYDAETRYPAEVLRFAAENAGPSRAEHFNGVPGGDYIGHDNCSPESGGCRFQSAAENQADLEAWYAGQEPEAGS